MSIPKGRTAPGLPPLWPQSTERQRHDIHRDGLRMCCRSQFSEARITDWFIFGSFSIDLTFEIASAIEMGLVNSNHGINWRAFDRCHLYIGCDCDGWSLSSEELLNEDNHLTFLDGSGVILIEGAEDLKAWHITPYSCMVTSRLRGSLPSILYFFEGPGGFRGGCASSRLDHGFKIPPGRLR